MPQRILLAHLEPEVEAELKSALSRFSASLECERASDAFVDWRGYDVVFCPAEPAEVSLILAAATSTRRKPMVIAASRIPEERKWLDVMEAGAKDYVGAPFEDKQIGRMLAACA